MNNSTKFSDEVTAVLGDVLVEFGFEGDSVIDGAENELSIAYYRSADCKLQIYRSPREGETNCMIARLTQPNQFGSPLSRKSWFYLPSLAGRTMNMTADELRARRRNLTKEDFSPDGQLRRLRETFQLDFVAARDVLLSRSEMQGG